ncbi:histidine kinase [Nonomuraea pusilla]|uniref:sensor histidine kinase n=1 Tax=Nonomuraea pusilla TaxID=46177 RepID=UPI00332F2B1D
MTDQTSEGGHPRRPVAGPSRLSRLGRVVRVARFGDIPVVVMLAWAGWLAVPWSFSGLAQARAAAAAAATGAQPPHAGVLEADAAHLGRPRTDGPPTDAGVAARPWGIPAAPEAPATTVLPAAGPAERPPGGAGDTAYELARERARLAGEVHDAAGHGLAAIAMQAGLALVALDDDPEQARASLLAIRETSRTALAQLRAALDGIDPPGGDLRALVEGVRAAGLPVELVPDEPAVPRHLREPVYRVVREALTNVLRHAGPTTAVVRLSELPEAYVLEVADRGRGGAGGPEGRGLAGMRARVAEAGGRLAAGPREGGGFEVVATFPPARTPA